MLNLGSNNLAKLNLSPQKDNFVSTSLQQQSNQKVTSDHLQHDSGANEDDDDVVNYNAIGSAVYSFPQASTSNTKTGRAKFKLKNTSHKNKLKRSITG